MTAPNAQTEQNTVLVLRHPKNALPLTFGVRPSGELEDIARYLEGVGSGLAAGENWVEIYRGSTSAAPAAATQTLVISGGSGAVGGVINGVTVTGTWATSDAVSGGVVSAAIRASSNALVQGLVSASNLGATITLATAVAGNWVEICPVGGTPVRFTAIAGSQANGPGIPPTFSIDTSDTAAALALVAAINAYPGFKGKLFCSAALGVVTVIQLVQSATAAYRVQKSGSPITLSAAGAFANQATVVVWALQRGKLGNAVTLAASGTGVTATAARLTGGVGGDPTTPYLFRR